MKKLVSGTLVLLASASLFAQANSDVTTQVGNLNLATVNQVGALNSNVLDQYLSLIHI